MKKKKKNDHAAPQRTDAAPDAEASNSGTLAEDDSTREIERVSARVPWLGEGKRWYDVPYRVFSWMLQGWPRRFLPQSARTRLNYWLNWLIPFNEVQRHRVERPDSPMGGISVPEDEHVTMPRLWAVEIFTPSNIDRLEHAIKTHKWDAGRLAVTNREANDELLKRSRSGSGWSWWQLAEIAAPGEPLINFLDGVNQRLPPPFRSVALTAVQIGTGLTAVVGEFTLTPQARSKVDEVWHEVQEPYLLWGRGRPQPLSRREATYRATRLARKRIHNAARDWLREVCPGSFADDPRGHTVLDLMIFDHVDPWDSPRRETGINHALSALGIGTDIRYRTAPQLAGLVLDVPHDSLTPDLDATRLWGLWGQRDRLSKIFPHIKEDEGDVDWQVSHRVGNGMRELLVRLSVSDLLQQLLEQHVQSRDLARRSHKKVHKRTLRSLRGLLLTLSLDTTTVVRDLAAYDSRGWRMKADAQFTVDLEPWMVALDQEQGRKRFSPLDLNTELIKSQRRQAKELRAADAELRAILATVADLTSFLDSLRVQRVAITIAVLSLVVALAALVGPTRLVSWWNMLADLVLSMWIFQ